ncbi:diguanylate cyclase [Vibrio rotiferianus]|uniref:sensor domain-containing diguanylate cyclase n=1 Tax=Vibrio rotiferianus TaxID=190895 RepID=UPI0038B325ED
MLLHYNRLTNASINIEIRSLLLVLAIIFIINTPISYIKREKIEDHAQQVDAAYESYKLRKSLISSYLNLSHTIIASHYFGNPIPFENTVQQLLAEQSLFKSIRIISNEPSHQFANSEIPPSYNHFYKSPLNAQHTQTVFFPKKGLVTKIAPIYLERKHTGYLLIDVNVNEMVANFRHNTILMSEDGFVYGSSHPNIAAFDNLKAEYQSIVEQLSRTRREAGTMNLGEFTMVYKKAEPLSEKKTFVILLVNSDTLTPNYFYAFLFLGAFAIGISYYLYLVRHDKRELSKITYQDELSGLYNRHYLKKVQKQTLKENAYFVGMIDIDHFKSVNDTYGHDIGDQVIKRVSAMIKSRIRISDYAFRVGGEEFVVMIKTDSKEVAHSIFERIRKDIANTNTVPKVTVSCGVSPVEHCLQQSIKSADALLYLAKNNGRNQVKDAA